MQEGRADDALHCPLVVEMERVPRDDRLVGQCRGFKLATVIRNGLHRQYGRISQVRRAERGGDRIYVRILTVEEAVGADRHLVPETEQIEFSVQRCRIAGDGEVRDGVEVLYNRIIPVVVSQRVRDAEQISHGILVKTANFEIPVVVELMLELDETRIGDEIRARPRLSVTNFGRINGGRQYNIRFAEINDAAR